MVKNPLAGAGIARSIPGQGTKTPHAQEPLSSHITAREKPVDRNRRSLMQQLHSDATKKINKFFLKKKRVTRNDSSLRYPTCGITRRQYRE